MIGDLYITVFNLNKNKNPAQMIIESLTSSMYGKTSIKPVETYTIINYNKDYVEKHTSPTYNCIDSNLEVKGRS